MAACACITGLQRIEGYDFAVIDTRGATGVIVESAALAADICLSPIPPEVMAAQEFIRGTVSLVNGLQSMSAFGIFTWCAMCVDLSIRPHQRCQER